MEPSRACVCSDANESSAGFVILVGVGLYIYWANERVFRAVRAGAC